jgi:hypothetical protein
MSAAPGWDDILDEGEEILWQGRPDTSLVFDANALITSAFGVVFLSGALLWLNFALTHTAGLGILAVIFPAFGLIFVVIGLYLVAGHYHASAYRRRNTWFTLTSKRAYVATAFLGQRSLKSWAVTPTLTLLLADGTPGSIWFDPGARPQRVGFERIADARAVLALMHRIQRGQNA